MPRKARIDAPGALHHIIIRGIEKRPIFDDDVDRQDFLSRLEQILPESLTSCYSWALMPNHVHLLLRSGLAPISTVMQRLLTGYAMHYNRRHKRYGHLFQNRYKSILCEEDIYQKVLVRYIHLNPVRARIVKNLMELTTYPYTGHSVLMGKQIAKWQDTKYVLKQFGAKQKIARKAYQQYISKGAAQGSIPELTGGGLVRSAGGWKMLRQFRGSKSRIKGDERILGSSEFVENVLQHAQEQLDHKFQLQQKRPALVKIISTVAELFDIDPVELHSSSKRHRVAQARSMLCYLAARHFRYKNIEAAKELNLSPAAVSRAIGRWKEIDNRTILEKAALRVIDLNVNK